MLELSYPGNEGIIAGDPVATWQWSPVRLDPAVAQPSQLLRVPLAARDGSDDVLELHVHLGVTGGDITSQAGNVVNYSTVSSARECPRAVMSVTASVSTETMSLPALTCTRLVRCQYDTLLRSASTVNSRAPPQSGLDLIPSRLFADVSIPGPRCEHLTPHDRDSARIGGIT